MMKRRILVRLVVVLIGVPLLVLTIALLYLNFADLGGWRDTVGRLATKLIGRELLINGDFELDIGFTTRLVASDITLANPRWSDDPEMASVDHLAGEIDLLSFLFGPMTIHNVEITGARALFELGSEDRFNWSFSDGEPGKGGGGDVELVISHALVRDLRVVYTSPQGQALEAELSKLEFTDDGGGMLDLDLVGSIRGTPLEVSGRLGTFVGLINAAAVEHDLTGRFADTEFTFRGTIDNLSFLTGVDEEASASGPDLKRIGAVFGLDPDIDGPFSVNASLRPSASATDFKLEAAAGGINARITGFVDSLTEPSILDAVVKASGPSIRTVGTLTGVTDLPEEEFSVSGGIRWDGFPIQVKQLEISVGDNSLSANGVLGAPPQMLGTDFTIQGQGPNASSLGALVGVDLPRDTFAVGGRVVRVEGGLQVDQVEVRFGRTTIEVDGSVGDPPEYEGTALEVRANGPNLAHFQDLSGIDLPAGPFEINGKLTQGANAINLEAAHLSFGRNTLQVRGQLTTDTGLTGTDLHLKAEGPDASQVAAMAGVSNVPSESFGVEGRVHVLETGYRVSDLVATLGSLAVKANGFVAPPPTLVGSDLQIHIEDSDISHPASIAGMMGLPHDSFTIDTRLRVEDPGYRLDGFTATVGDMELEVEGQIGAPPALEGTQVRVTARGAKFSSLNPYIDQTALPAAPFSVSGNARVNGGAYALDNVVAEVEGNSITLDGTIHPTAGFVGTDLEIRVSAPDLGRAGGLAAGFFALPALPAEPSTLNTRLRIEESGYKIENLRATLANAEASIDGLVGPPPGFVGTDLTIVSDGPNASLFTAFTGVTVPVAPFKFSGRIQRTEDVFLFERVAVQLGGHSINLHGSLGEAPRLVGTDLELSASGDNTALIAELTGFQKLPDRPFEISGRFRGTPERFTADSLDIVLGENDIKGSLKVDIRDKPEVTARIVSDHLDLAGVVSRRSKRGNEASDTQAASGPSKAGRVISDEPIDFDWLQRANADVEITIGALQMPVERFHDVQLNARLIDGRLEVYHLAMAGSRGGSGSGSLVLETVGDNHRVNLNLNIDAIHFEVAGVESPNAASEPPLDFDARLQALGATPHEMAASANGSVQIVVGKGVMDNRTLDLVSQDFLLTLLTAFNPFATDEKATELQCAIALLTFEDGLMTLDPMAMQSDKMTMLGHGHVDLGTEKLDFEWVTKPRKGIGLSASMITNPYIKLGGTLGKPAIELKGAQAVASTGVAVATLGISVVAKGMLDRVTAEKKVCQQALEEIGSRTGGSPIKSKKKK